MPDTKPVEKPAVDTGEIHQKLAALRAEMEERLGKGVDLDSRLKAIETRLTGIEKKMHEMGADEPKK